MTFPKHADLWFPAYLRDRARNLIPRPPAKQLWVSITDHYEPWGGRVSAQVAANRVAAWQDLWPAIAAKAPADAVGRQPCDTFFYPQEEYEVSTLNALAELTRNGTADVEVHLHHENDTAAAATPISLCPLSRRHRSPASSTKSTGPQETHGKRALTTPASRPPSAPKFRTAFS